MYVLWLIIYSFKHFQNRLICLIDKSNNLKLPYKPGFYKRNVKTDKLIEKCAYRNDYTVDMKSFVA